MPMKIKNQQFLGKFVTDASHETIGYESNSEKLAKQILSEKCGCSLQTSLTQLKKKVKLMSLTVQCLTKLNESYKQKNEKLKQKVTQIQQNQTYPTISCMSQHQSTEPYVYSINSPKLKRSNKLEIIQLEHICIVESGFDCKRSKFQSGLDEKSSLDVKGSGKEGLMISETHGLVIEERFYLQNMKNTYLKMERINSIDEMLREELANMSPSPQKQPQITGRSDSKANFNQNSFICIDLGNRKNSLVTIDVDEGNISEEQKAHRTEAILNWIIHETHNKFQQIDEDEFTSQAGEIKVC